MIAGLRQRFGEAVAAAPGRDMPGVEVARERLVEVCRWLKETGFEQLTDATAVDELPAEPRFRVVYHLLSLSRNRRLRITVRVPGEEPEVDSLVPVWAGANFLEREAWDMFGIRFRGHPGLKRILMPEDYEHHPLRKDFPVRGIDPARSFRRWNLGRQA